MSRTHGMLEVEPRLDEPRIIAAPDLEWSSIRAVLFDLDGTLYGQSLVRVLMAGEMLTLPASRRSLVSATRVWRAIATYRRVREELRAVQPGDGDVSVLQFTETARRTGDTPGEIEAWVNEWMHRRPLKYLRLSRRSGLTSLLAHLADSGIQRGVLSDYPAATKLAALGLSKRFSLVLCTTDPEIGAFKPHPAGYLRACALWNLRPRQVLYVGDRPEVDAAGAAAAGMPCAIVASAAWRNRRRSNGYVPVPFYGRLTRAFARSCHA